MQPFRTLSAIACPLPLSGIDTDQLIPARFMKRPRAEGYGTYLLHDLRHDEAGQPVATFPLNDPTYGGAAIIVARRNFGAGSSREAAVYGLLDYGIRCVVAPSFGDIFAANAVNNGLLPARLPETDTEELLSRLDAGLGALHVDLDAQTITAGERLLHFEVEPVWRTKLLNGWDDLDLTQSYRGAIEDFAQTSAQERPWVRPRPF
jgi:3-isopropylmalate/(R)-2-methylmalate dehydratase small subunit